MASPPSSVTPGTGTWIWANPFGSVSRAASIGVANEIDPYRFMADQTGTYSITVTSSSLDSQFRVYDSNGQAISGIIDLHGAGGTETYTLSNYPTATWFYVHRFPKRHRQLHPEHQRPSTRAPAQYHHARSKLYGIHQRERQLRR
jgi:hypothetical protein